MRFKLLIVVVTAIIMTACTEIKYERWSDNNYSTDGNYSGNDNSSVSTGTGEAGEEFSDRQETEEGTRNEDAKIEVLEREIEGNCYEGFEDTVNSDWDSCGDFCFEYPEGEGTHQDSVSEVLVDGADVERTRGYEWSDSGGANSDCNDADNDNKSEGIEDVWDMGLQWYGIDYLDTTRILKLITYEGYEYSPLSYYVACCCWVRATENYWGYGNLFSAFGEADTSYGLWMDGLGIADWAYDALDECYRNPTYVKYCNGMAEPNEYVYSESGIYVWN